MIYAQHGGDTPILMIGSINTPGDDDSPAPQQYVTKFSSFLADVAVDDSVVVAPCQPDIPAS